MKIKKVTDPEFSRYGRVIDGYDFSKLIKAMEHTPLPEDVIYEPSIEELETTDVAIDLKSWKYFQKQLKSARKDSADCLSRLDTVMETTIN